MKKLILIISLLFILPAISLAATMNSAGLRMYLNEVGQFDYVTITASTAGEVTAEHGINVMISIYDKILWDAVDSLVAEGTAVDNGKIAASVVPEYNSGYTVMHLPVLADFAAGESVTLHGVRMRAYDQQIAPKYLILDVNGDMAVDAYDVGTYRVSDASSVTDKTPPYQPADFTADVASDFSSVTLSWQNPPDYDFNGTSLRRTVIRLGSTISAYLFENLIITEYVDTDVQKGDQVSYELFALDDRNASEALIINLDLMSAPEEPIEPEPESPISPVDPEEEEIDKLNRLYNYYKVRHEIRCLGPSAQPTSSLCLWAKIDLVYTQEKTGQSDVLVSLYENDLYLMALRVQWPERRYQINCIEAEVPEEYCEALGESLKRIHYFID